MMKKIAILAVSLSFIVLMADPTLRKIIFYNFTGIDDYKIFSNRTLSASPHPFRFKEAFDPARIPQFIPQTRASEIPLDDYLESLNTLAFLVAKDDILVYEKYFHGHSQTSISMAFSVTKAIFSALLGIAIEDGYIQSLEQPVTDYVPELAGKGFEKVKLKYLLQMTSGMGYPDHGWLNNPFGKQARLSYTHDLPKELLSVRLESEPGTIFMYKSVDNALLSLALHRALTPLTLTAYLQEKIWTPLGMESDALWSIDQAPDGLEKTWCCISATARDLAKFGRLYLHGGQWAGRMIIPRSWIRRSTQADGSEGSSPRYQYGWWIMSETEGDYRAEGVRGQFIYVNPLRKVIIVRLGEDRGGLDWEGWKTVLTFIAKGVT